MSSEFGNLNFPQIRNNLTPYQTCISSQEPIFQKVCRRDQIVGIRRERCYPFNYNLVWKLSSSPEIYRETFYCTLPISGVISKSVNFFKKNDGYIYTCDRFDRYERNLTEKQMKESGKMLKWKGSDLKFEKLEE